MSASGSFSALFIYLYLVCLLYQAKGESNIPWRIHQRTHSGFGLSDQDLRNLAGLADYNHFNKVLKPILKPRVVGTQNHDDVRKHIVSSMEASGWTVEQDAFQDDTPHGRKTFTNIIATLSPFAVRRLIIACHYDSKYFAEGNFIGATDSAVPCAMMLNMAHVLRKQFVKHGESDPELTIQFKFFDGEEAFNEWGPTDSIYGARHLAAKLENTIYSNSNGENTNEIDRIDLLALLDLIGTQDCSFYSIFQNTEKWYSRLVSFERRLDDLGLLNHRKPLFLEKTYYQANIEDDHVPYLQRGVPILHLICIPFPDVWHKMSDNAKALHPPTIQNLNLIIQAFVADYLRLIV